jgi:type VI secretion system protein ImpH
MAADSGPPPEPLSAASPADPDWRERLAEVPGRFDFHVALRRFDASHPERPRLGEAERPSEERVRIGQTPSSAFTGAELTDYVEEGDGASGADGTLARLTIGFLGLWGPSGPLPSHITEYAHERLHHAGDPTLVRFVDIFHHRMLVLFHRAWATAQPTVSMDRPESDAFAAYVGALMGLGLQATRQRGGATDFAKMHYAPLFAASSRNADGLRDIISDYFEMPAAIEEFVGEWLDLPEDERWHLGESRETGALGRVALGRRIWSRASKFRVLLGPLGAAEFEQMLPGGAALAELSSLVRLYTNDEWDWELRLALAPSVSAPIRLGRGGRLGWTTRIGSSPSVEEVDVVVDPVTSRTRRMRRPSSAVKHAHVQR